MKIDIAQALEKWHLGVPDAEVSAKWKSDAVLFVMWGLSDKEFTPRFWNFVRRASEETVTEELFEQCFGFGYGSGNERVHEFQRKLLSGRPVEFYRCETPPSIPALTIRSARGVEIGRILGEWRRQFALLHSDSAMRTAALDDARASMASKLPKAEGDVGLLAALGLCERLVGRNEEAHQHLSAAVAGNAIRPRAYLELARLEYERVLLSLHSPTSRLTAEQTRTILAPLWKGRTMSPELVGVYELMCSVWQRSEVSPNAEDLAAIHEGARLFPREAALIEAAIRLHNEHGRKDVAADLTKRWRKGTPRVENGRSR